MANLKETFNPANKEPDRWKIGCWAVLMNLFLAMSFLWGIDEARAAWYLQTKGVVTQGSVIRLAEEYSDENSRVYRPVIEFKVNDQVYTFNSNYASAQPEYQVGERVNVRYDPTDPNVAQIDSYGERWVIPAMVLLVAMTIILGANFFMFQKWKLAKPVEASL